MPLGKWNYRFIILRSVIVGSLLLVASCAWSRSFPATSDALAAAQQRWGATMQGYVASGCLHATSASTTISVPACRGFAVDTSDPRTLKGFEEPTARSFALTAGNGTYWLGARWNPGVTPGSWTAVPGTHYVWILSATEPLWPSGVVPLSRSTVTAGAVASVEDFRIGHAEFGRVINVLDPIYNVDPTGNTDAVTGLNAACLAAKRLVDFQQHGAIILVPPGKYYLPNGGWVCDLNENTLLTGYGAIMFSSSDHALPMLDINPDGSCPGPFVTTCSNPVRNAWVKGFVFDNRAVAKTQSVGLKAFAIRHVTFEDLYFKNFWTNMDIAIQDNLRLMNSRLLCNSGCKYNVHQRDLQVLGIPSAGILIEGNDFLSDSSVIAQLALRANSFESVWVTNNVFAGESQYGVLLWQDDPAQTFVSEGIYIQENHFEQGPAGHTYIALLRNASPIGYQNVRISKNRLGGPIAGGTDIELEDTQHVTISENWSIAPSAGITRTFLVARGVIEDVYLCNNLEDVNLLPVDSSAMTTPLSEIRSCDAAVVFPAGSVITGYNLNTFSDATATIDMSTAWSSYPATDPVPPVAYAIAVNLFDSGSAACPSADCLVVIKRDASFPADRTDIRCHVAGMANNFERQCQGVVPADANGDIYVDVKASGAGTMTVTLRVQAYYR